MQVLLVLEVVLLFSQAMGWGSNDRVLLSDVTAITLEEGKMTFGRRSSAVSQLSCVGGTAHCQNSYLPHRVQCMNRGSDGNDAQWECKADMDRAVRFGRIQVSCEGYEYPNDPYILKGSCGLEYEMDYTGDGQDGNRNYGYNSHGSYGSNKGYSVWGKLIQVLIMLAIFYGLYKCLWTGQRRQPAPPTTSTSYSDVSGSYARNSAGTGVGGTGGGPGFWSGAATGGLLGYLFGNRGGGGYGGQGYRGGYGRGSWGGGYGGGGSWGGFGRGGSGWSSSRGGWSSGGGGGGSSRSSGSRSTSGFGGTSRR